MKIKNIDGLSADELQREVSNGGRFVFYAYTISAIVITFKRTSGVYLIRNGENAAAKGIRFTLITLFFGWWGIPWGPLHSIESLRTNLHGGKNVTDEVMSVVAGYVLYEETQKKKAV